MKTGRDKTQIGRRAVTRRAAAWAAALVALTGCFLPTSKVYAADEYGSGWYFDDTSGSYGDTGRLTISTDEGMSKFFIKSTSSRVRYIIIEDGVTSIPDQKFNGAWTPYNGRYAKGITIAGSVKSIGKQAFYNTTSLLNLTLSEGLESIGDEAFAGSLLSDVTIPASVKSIGDEAFSCNISSVTMLSETPPELGEDVFWNAKFYTHEIGIYDDGKKYGIFVPEGSVQAYREAWPAYKKYIYSPYPLGDEEKNLDPTQTDEDSDKPAYTDTTIDVQAHTLNKVVYSVDVEWGAMTFRYENSIWDATAHQTQTGAGWQVYDSVNDKALDTTEDAINRIQVTNHSNADVKAVLDYAGQTGYEDTTGRFAKAQGDADTSYDDTEQTLTLATADNGGGEDGAGKETVGCVYFMPDGIEEGYKTGGIAKWTQLGTIKVGIETVD